MRFFLCAWKAVLGRRLASPICAFHLGISLGCGPGSITLGLARAVYPGRVTGLDQNGEQVELARVGTMEEQAGNARFVTGDALELPFPDGSLGRRPLPRLLMHSPRIREQLAEIMRVMKPGGILGSRDMDVPASLPHKCRFHLGFSLVASTAWAWS